jgi:hypothetical protein
VLGQGLDDEVGNGPAVLPMQLCRKASSVPSIDRFFCSSLHSIAFVSLAINGAHGCSCSVPAASSPGRCLSGRSAHKGTVVPPAVKGHDKAEPSSARSVRDGMVTSN